YFSGFLQPRTSQGLKDFFQFDILPKIPGLYSKDFTPENSSEKNTIDAGFLSHSHMDHYGNLNLIREDIPIYMGETSALILQSIQDTSRPRFGRPYIRKSTEKNSSNVRTFRTGDVIQLPDVEITPIHVDHSLPGAYGFIINNMRGNCTIGYTGDLRLHGWRKDLTEDFIKMAKKMNLNALLMEGTNINEDFNMNERKVQKDLSQAVADTEGLAIANYSLRDIDRFRSFYLSAKENGRKLLINTKQAYLLQKLQEDIHLDIPSLEDEYIQVYKRPKMRYYRWETEILENESIVCVSTPDFDQTEYIFHCDFWNLTDLIDVTPKDATLFYSHGEPFTDEGEIDFRRMQEWVTHFNLDFKQYHASGHAPRSDLKQIVDSITPELLIPIHSEHPEMYKEVVDVPILLPTRGRSIKVY
ncbi:MAG: MBL fold metallo-hydrolase, partial [Candidatus Hodarchaeales archaeon]